jgi:signal transduction histidine kinase
VQGITRHSLRLLLAEPGRLGGHRRFARLKIQWWPRQAGVDPYQKYTKKLQWYYLRMKDANSYYGALPGATPIHDLIRRHDWSTSPLGEPAGWSQSLRYIFTMMLESTIPMSIVWGSKRVLLYNQSYVPFLGAKHPTQAFGLPICDVWPEIWADIGPLIERAAAGDAFYLEDVPLTISRNGVDEGAWFTFSYSPVRDDHGALNGMCSSVLETTSRVIAEQRQAFLLSLSTAFNKLSDPEQIMRTAARMACTYLGVNRIMYAEPDFVRDLVVFLPGYADLDAPDIDGEFQLSGFGERHVDALASGEDIVIDDVATDQRIADDSHRKNYLQLGAHSVVALPLIRGGKAMAVIIVNHTAPRAWKSDEITLIREIGEFTWNAVEHARAERGLRQLTATLEERIAERTAALERAMGSLRDTNRHKDQFLAMLAHELRNPLAPISAATAILTMPGISYERISKTSEIIGRQVKHMVGMVDDLLDVSRVTTGRIELDQHPVSIELVLRDALEQTRPLLDTRNHTCQITLINDQVLVHADAKRLVQVFANILNNASKYTAPGGAISISVKAKQDNVVIEIADNGIGISADVLPYVFDLFVQGVRTSDRSQGGLGIGLALVKSLVDLHNGHVSVESAGSTLGTAVRVTLPRLPTEEIETESIHDAEPSPSGIIQHTRILVVDDNIDAGSMLGMALDNFGFKVIVEHNPIKALQLADVQDFDAFLLDIGMPLMDGNELARHLRKQPRYAKALMVAISGYGSQAARQLAVDAGFDHYLTKPADIGSLLAILKGAGQSNLG